LARARHRGRGAGAPVLPDGRLATDGSDGTIRLWDPARGAETARLEGGVSWLQAVAALADGPIS
jgi:WD40 repeat protein